MKNDLFHRSHMAEWLGCFCDYLISESLIEIERPHAFQVPGRSQCKGYSGHRAAFVK
jgi:hypothetical protein